MTRRTATVVAATRRTRSTAAGSCSVMRTAAFLLVAVVLLADAITVAECRSFRQDHRQVQRNRRGSDDTRDYMADGAPVSDDEEELDVPAESTGGGVSVTPTILTSGLVVETAEGTTVNLPCKVADGSLDDVVLIWINGTKSIMTDLFPSTIDPRIKPGNQSAPTTAGYVEHTLVIEQVTRWDSGSYTCRITSEPPVEITHTLRVIHPAKILSVRTAGAAGSTNTVVAKKLTVKQGDPVQLICNVAGYPEPTAMWSMRAKYQQQQQQLPQSTQSPPGQDQSPSPPQRATVVVSNTNEVRIESVVAYRDAGYYECTAHNSISPVSDAAAADPMGLARSGLELEVEYQPDVVVPRPVVIAGEAYTAQMACSVHAFPKAKVTWEKEQTTGDESSWQPLVSDGPNSRFEMSRPISTAQSSANSSATPIGPKYLLKVKQVQGPQDFGRYRCKAENTQGVTYSEAITLTGSPAEPISTYVQIKTSGGYPELGWNVDSWSPLIEYQLQYKRQQDSQTSWKDVQPSPQVVETPIVGSAVDERRYTVSYVFGDNEQLRQSLEYGTTYLVHIRARNVHGWSDWSNDVVTVLPGGMDEDLQANEIAQHDDKVLKASTTGGASGQRQSYYNAVAAIVLATATAAAASSFC